MTSSTDPVIPINGCYITNIDADPMIYSKHLIFPKPGFDLSNPENLASIGMTVTGMPALNAIRAVVAAPPGGITSADLPLRAFCRPVRDYYFLHGIEFEKRQYFHVIDHQLLIQDITALDDADQRAIALQYLTFELLVLDSDSDAELLDRGVRGTELYRLGCRHDWPVIGMNHPVRFRTRSDRGRQLLSSA